MILLFDALWCAGAPLHALTTETAFKYLDEDITRMASETGYGIVDRFWDSKHLFCDSLWKTVKLS